MRRRPRRVMRASWVLVGALALAGCVSGENSEAVRLAREEAGVRPPPERLDAGAVSELLRDRTRVSRFGPSAQITYTSADGRSYLWFPGNRVVVSGSWSIQERGGYEPALGRPAQRYSACFRYPGARPVFAGGDGCIPAETIRRLLVEIRPGDVFGLSERREVPFVLGTGQPSIDEALARGRTR